MPQYKKYPLVINIRKLVKYNNTLSSIYDIENEIIGSDAMSYVLSISKHMLPNFEHCIKLLLDEHSKLYRGIHRPLATLDIHTMIVIANLCNLEYRQVFNGSYDLTNKLINHMNDYLNVLHQALNINDVRGQIYLKGKYSNTNRVELSDKKVVKIMLAALREDCKVKVENSLDEINASNFDDNAFHLMNVVRGIILDAPKEKENEKHELAELRLFFERNKDREETFRRLVEKQNKSNQAEPESERYRYGLRLGHVFSFLYRYLETETQFNSQNPKCTDSDQNRIIHYISAAIGIVKLEADYSQQAQSVKNILPKRKKKEILG